jgi:hypothetical protein
MAAKKYDRNIQASHSKSLQRLARVKMHRPGSTAMAQTPKSSTGRGGKLGMQMAAINKPTSKAKHPLPVIRGTGVGDFSISTAF